MDGRRDNSLHNNAIRGQQHNGNKRTPFISLVFVDVFFFYSAADDELTSFRSVFAKQ